MSSPLTVFVCSTFADLSEERESVLEAIRHLQLQHDSMEFFGARSNQPIETCLAEVRRSNVLVVIVGHRYGSIVPTLGLSFSQAEYDEGYRLKKPCLVYIRGEDVPVLPRHMERDADNLRLLDVWKSTLRQRHTVAMFETAADLAVRVAADLGRTMRSLEDAEQSARLSPPAELPLWDEVRAAVNEALERGAPDREIVSAVRRATAALVAHRQDVEATVFMSYASADREVVRQFANALRRSGINVWIDEASLTAGVDWAGEIRRALDTVDFIVFFISPHSVNRGWAKKEIEFSLRRRVSGQRAPVLLPVLLAPADVPPLLRDIQWLDMQDGDVQRGADRLVQAIRQHQSMPTV